MRAVSNVCCARLQTDWVTDLTMRTSIDFNCDLGEGCGSDADIIPLISSASIACGGHAGEVVSMRETLQLCAEHGVIAGAHPSYPDRENFGRVPMDIEHAALRDSLIEQLRSLQVIASEVGVTLRHIKPHGALYNDAAKDALLADVVLDAVEQVDPALQVMGLAGSLLIEQASARGFGVIEEAFVERGYQANGQLAPRGTPGAVLETIEASLAQLDDIVRNGEVTAVSGERIALRADTVCLHGDREDAAAFARDLRNHLDQIGIEVKA